MAEDITRLRDDLGILHSARGSLSRAGVDLMRFEARVTDAEAINAIQQSRSSLASAFGIMDLNIADLERRTLPGWMRERIEKIASIIEGLEGSDLSVGVRPWKISRRTALTIAERIVRQEAEDG